MSVYYYMLLPLAHPLYNLLLALFRYMLLPNHMLNYLYYSMLIHFHSISLLMLPSLSLSVHNMSFHSYLHPMLSFTHYYIFMHHVFMLLHYIISLLVLHLVLLSLDMLYYMSLPDLLSYTLLILYNFHLLHLSYFSSLQNLLYMLLHFSSLSHNMLNHYLHLSYLYFDSNYYLSLRLLSHITLH